MRLRYGRFSGHSSLKLGRLVDGWSPSESFAAVSSLKVYAPHLKPNCGDGLKAKSREKYLKKIKSLKVQVVEESLFEDKERKAWYFQEASPAVLTFWSWTVPLGEYTEFWAGLKYIGLLD